MSDEQSHAAEQSTPQEAARRAAADAPCTSRSSAHDDWLEEPEELPRRPRRRLLSPVPLALLGGAADRLRLHRAACSSRRARASAQLRRRGAASGLAARFAALRGGASGADGQGSGAGTSAAARRAGGLGGADARRRRRRDRRAGRLRQQGTLYVTTAEGNTVKVKTSAGDDA